jgi:hypothetical protein
MDTTEDLMRYDQMAQDALRSVVREALKRAAGQGLPGKHHFYITFKTLADGVSIPSDLGQKYPDEMTIVLEHQFWDLAASDQQFSVTLRFAGAPKRLIVPYTAVTRFFDPSVRFGLQFDVAVAAAPVAVAVGGEEPQPRADEPASSGDDEPTPPNGGATVVRLDKFRKKT